MKVVFHKYHGTGNDFILIDNRNKKFKGNRKTIAGLCHRRFGIGADGLMLLQTKKGFDFEMVYFNSDGNESTFCGNGSRCIVAFAKNLGVLKKKETTFLATDGIHQAKILAPKSSATRDEIFVSMKMRDVSQIEIHENSYLLDTGSPHYVEFVEGLKDREIVPEARKVRYSDRFSAEGVNVNYAEKNEKGVYVRTYERGVEDETWSCGTGVTATALVSALKGIATAENHCKISTPGGELTVRFHRGNGSAFSDIWLEGPAARVFKGEIHL